MKVKLKFKKLQDVNYQYNSGDIIFFITTIEMGVVFSVPHHFRFHKTEKIYNYNHQDESEENWKQFCRRMKKEYTWDW